MEPPSTPPTPAKDPVSRPAIKLIAEEPPPRSRVSEEWEACKPVLEEIIANGEIGTSYRICDWSNPKKAAAVCQTIKKKVADFEMGKWELVARRIDTSSSGIWGTYFGKE